MRFLQRLSVIITLGMVSALAFYCIQIGWQLQAEIPTLHGAIISVQNIESATVATEGQMSGLLDDADTIAENEQKAQNEQLSSINALSKKANNLLDDASTSVKKLGTAADNLGQIAPATEVAIDKVTRDIHDTLRLTEDSLQAATDNLNNPDIKATENNIQSITDDLHTETSILVDQTRQAIKPKSKLKTALGGTMTLLELLYYAIHLK